eukprot:GFUD01026829.1.p1 GENE.GFUD01026829.1~~GFUD01026829.1.p1  ORF type:complete len:303 (-),score=65.31 GFUD01026829.1:95-1003(-)
MVEVSEENMDYCITEDATGDSDFDNQVHSVDNAVADTSDFFVFPDPTDPESQLDDAHLVTVTESDEDISNVTRDPGLDNVDADSEGLSGTSNTSLSVVEPCTVALVRKRTFDQSLLDCWSNDDLEYTNSVKRWRFNPSDEQDEMEGDETMIEVSDCDEGSDIVELPVVEDHEAEGESVSLAEDCRSILLDSDLQIFPLERMITEIGMSMSPLPNLVNSLDSVVTTLQFTDAQSECIEDNDAKSESVEDTEAEDTEAKSDLLVSDVNPSREIGEVLELTAVKWKVEPNNFADDLLSNLLIDLP